MASGDITWLADRNTLNEVKTKVENIQYKIPVSSPATYTPPTDNAMATKEVLDTVNTEIGNIPDFTFSGDGVPSQMLSGKTFYNTSITKQTGTMPDRSNYDSASSYTDATFKSGISGSVFAAPSVAGYYTTASYIKVPITNFSAENIKAGVAVGGIAGTYTSDADADASDIANGKTAYVNGVKKTGTAMTIGATYTLIIEYLTDNSLCGVYNAVNDFITTAASQTAHYGNPAIITLHSPCFVLHAADYTNHDGVGWDTFGYTHSGLDYIEETDHVGVLGGYSYHEFYGRFTGTSATISFTGD